MRVPAMGQVMLLMLAVGAHAKCAVAAHDSGFRRVLLGDGGEADVHDAAYPKKRKTQLMLMMLAAGTYSMKGKCGQC